MPAPSSVADQQSPGGAPSPDGAQRGLLGAPLRILRSDPSAVPALGALALLIAWAANQAGFPQTHWAPGGIILLALLVIAVGATGLRVASIPWPVRIALGALAAYTAFSFLSILWAGVPGDAWEGADRTLVYLIVFALFASFRRPAASAALLLALWALAMAGLAVFTVLHVDAAAGSAARLQALMPGGRLIFPAGYTNANAAMWMMACFPALILASARRLPWWVRGPLAGGTVVLAGAAMYSDSRGAVYSTPIVLAIVFLLLPGRVRTFATLIPVAVGVAASAPQVLRFDERVEVGSGALAAAHSATLSVLLAGVSVAVVVALVAAIESRGKVSERTGARARRAVATVGVLALVALVAGGLAAVGNPVAKAEHEWNTFASEQGYQANEAGQSRLISGLGSGRSDFYRVAWHEFLAHPLLGIGVDNFAVEYLRRGHTLETPSYPHSVEIRTLAETGLIGTIIAIVGLAASALAARRVLTLPDSLVRTVAAAAVAGFLYWAVHGSFDWFFEYAGLGAAAFMLLGLTCSLVPERGSARAAEESSPADRAPRRRRIPAAPRIAAALGVIVLVLAVAASLTAPWLSRMEVQSAGRIWTTAPTSAYARLRQAGQINPLSAEPSLVAGTIALRLREYGRARREFELALQRTPENAYATLELGAIASSSGNRLRALGLLQRAVRLNPRGTLPKEALETARKGGRVDLTQLNSAILLEAEHLS